MTYDPHTRYPQAAAELGEQHGRNAADWIELDNLTASELLDHAHHTLDDDIPKIADRYRLPDLSGEMADGLTPATLQDALDWDYQALTEPGEADDLLDRCCEVYENAVHEAFWARLTGRCLRHLLDNLEGA